MSDDKNDDGGSGAKGLVTITSDSMQALDTNGTNEIVPPDSPKKGHLFLLRTTVTPEGIMEIQRTLVEEGENRDFDEVCEITDPVSVQSSDPNRLLEGRCEVGYGHLGSIEEHRSETEESQPQNENLESKRETGRINSKKESELDNQEPSEENKSDVQESSPLNANLQQNLNDGHQETVDEHKTETLDASLKRKDNELIVESAEEYRLDARPASGKMKASGSSEIADAAVSEVLGLEKAEVKEVKEDEKDVDKMSAGGKSKPKRTMTLPASHRFALPWQKKHLENDPALAKSSIPTKTERKSDSATSTAATTTVIINPLSGVMRNIKKSFKIKVGGLSKSSEESAPGRIPQRSGARPSPRIVSSLNITPTHQPEVAVEPDSPASRRRKEIEEILNTMPPSPTPSMDNLEENADVSSPPHIHDNLPQGDRQKEKTVTTPSEEEIFPSVASRPVLSEIRRAMDERKALNLIESMKPEPADGRTAEKVRPPRPQPAKREQPNSSEFVPRNLPPPPRPVAPPKVTLQKSYTLAAANEDHQHDNDDIISPVTSPSPLQDTPVETRQSHATASLDRRKLYRSKAENRTAKRVTLSRPMTMHETTFTVKQNHNEDINKSLDEGANRPKSHRTKIVYEQRDSITLPKFLLGNKKKPVAPLVPHPQLAATPTNENGGISALRSIAASEDGSYISPRVSNVQCSMPPTQMIQCVSAGVQTIPQRPRPPISSLRRGTNHPTLLTVATAPWELTELHKNTAFVEAYYKNKIKPLIKSPLKSPPASPSDGNEIPIPSVGERIVKLTKNAEEAKSSLFAFQHSHKTWFAEYQMVNVEKSASEELVNRCLQEYMAACCRLRSVDLQGEFAAFHWQYGDLADAGWIKRGIIAGYSELEVFYDPSRLIDFVKLPPLEHSVGRLIYPEKTIDLMLSTWIDIGQTQVSTTPTQSGLVIEPVFHPAFAIIRLSDLLEEMRKTEETCYGLRPSLTLAILLSIDQCSANLPQSLDSNEKLFLNLNPAEIIILSSPANSLVIFRIANSEGDWNIQKLLLQLYPDCADSLKSAVNACFESLSKEAKTRLQLPALLEAVAPPDWVVQTVVRIALGKGEVVSHSQDGC